MKYFNIKFTIKECMTQRNETNKYTIIKLLKREGVVEIILYVYNNGKSRYSELKNVLNSEATLVRALKLLTEEGILKRKILDEKYRPTEYVLTEKGRKIGKRIKALLELEE